MPTVAVGPTPVLGAFITRRKLRNQPNMVVEGLPGEASFP